MTEGGSDTTSNGNTPRYAAFALTLLCVVAFLISVDSALLTFVGFRIAMLAAAILPAVAVALACTGLGHLVVGRAAVNLHRTERVVLAFACGLGLMSCGVAAVGFSGALNQLSALVLVGIGLVAGLPLWKSIAVSTTPDNRIDPPHPRSVTSTLLIVLLVIAITMLGVFSLTPPLLFDVTEYHLGAWTDYARPDGPAWFAAMSHNFYARFPFPIESVYFLGLALSPVLDTAPKVLNAICVIACAALAAMFVRRCNIGRGGQLLAALATFTLPVMLDVSIDAMIDAPVALLVAGSVFAGWMAAGRFPVQTAPVPFLILPAAFLFGSALAAKYTVAQVYLLPWALVALPSVVKAGRRHPTLLFFSFMLAAVPVLIWLGKNVALYGNPLEPFFVKWFRAEDPAAIAREQFYVESHFPQSPLSAAYWASLLPRLHEFTWLYLAACAAWYFRSQRGLLVKVATFSAIAFLLWNLVRESQDRFLLPVLILVTSAAVAGICAIPSRTYRRVAAGLVVLFCAMQMTAYALKLGESGAVAYLLDFYPEGKTAAPDSNEPTPRQKFIEKNLGDLGKMITHMDKTIRDPGAKVLLVYEARPYLFRQATDYNVVWDDSVLLNNIRGAATPAEAWQRLADAGYTHVLINRQELLRYIQQYARKSQLLRLGVGPGEDPRSAWGATAHPEDLYPPFYRDKDWETIKPVLQAFLAEADQRAVAQHGVPASAGSKGIDIILVPVLN